MKKDNQIKQVFCDITVSQELEDKILNKTINAKEKRKFNYVYVLPLVLLICGIFMSVVYAEEIKTFFENWKTKIVFENDEVVNVSENSIYKKLPTTLTSSEGFIPMTMTYSEMEKELGFHLLSSPLSNNESLSYTTSQNSDGSIGRLDINWNNFIINSNGKSVSLSMFMLNENAEDRYIAAFVEGIDATGGKEYKNTYQIESLNTKVIVYGSDWDANRITATFVYDNVCYQLLTSNMAEEELVEIIKTLR